MAEVNVSLVSENDRNDWLDLWNQWQTHMKGKVPDEVSEATWKSFMDRQSGLDCLLARGADGRPLGFACISRTPFAWTASDIIFLQDLFVSESARGQGIGSILLRSLYDHADRTDASQVFWMVDEDDTELQGFYARRAIRTPYLRYMRVPWPW